MAKIKAFVITMLAVIICCAVALLGGDNTFAATKTWTGGGDGYSMNDPANWSDNTVPVSGDSLTFDDFYHSWPNIDNNIPGLNLSSVTIACSVNNNNGVSFYDNALSIASAITNNGCEYANFYSSDDITLAGNVTFDKINFNAPTLNIGSYTLSIVGPSFIYSNVTGTGVINATGTQVPATISEILMAQLVQPDQVQVMSLANFSGTVNANTLFVTAELAGSTATINVNPGGAFAIIWSPEIITATINIYNPNVSMAFVCQSSDCDSAPFSISNINLFTNTTFVAIQIEDLASAVNKISLAGLNYNDHCLTLESVSAYELASGIGNNIVTTDPADFFTGIEINPFCDDMTEELPEAPNTGYTGKFIGDKNYLAEVLAFVSILATSTAILLAGVVTRQ